MKAGACKSDKTSAVNANGSINAGDVPVNDGTAAGDVMIPMGVLSGDTNANGTVNAGDVAQTKGQSGIAVGAGNFRTDVNSNGRSMPGTLRW